MKRLNLALAIVLAVGLSACSSNKVKVEAVKPNPLPKIAQSKSLDLIFEQSVNATAKQDPLRMQLAFDNATYFLLDPVKGSVAAYRDNKRIWQQKVSKIGLTAGVSAAEGIVVVANRKGVVFALDQATGQQKWTAQTTASILSPALIIAGRVISQSNDNNVFAFDVSTGQQFWSYKISDVPFSLRGTASPVKLDERTVLIAASNAYVYALDAITGVARFQRRVAVSDGRSDVSRLIDIDADPVVSGQFMITSSFQGQLTVTDLASQRVIWSEEMSANQSPAANDTAVYVTDMTGVIRAYALTTGDLLWKNDSLLNRQLSNPVLLGNDLVIGDLDGVLHLLDPATGQLIGRAKTSGEVRSLRNVNGQLFAATRKGALTVWQNR